MTFILLVGAAYNFVGGFQALGGLVRGMRGPGAVVQLQLFVGATAFTLGAMYVYLYVEPHYIFPFLIFGTAMKYAAFGASLYARLRHDLSQAAFLSSGVGNLLLAVGFTALLVSLRTQSG